MTDRAVARCCCRCWLKSPSSLVPAFHLSLFSFSPSNFTRFLSSFSLSFSSPFSFLPLLFVPDKELAFSSSSRTGSRSTTSFLHGRSGAAIFRAYRYVIMRVFSLVAQIPFPRSSSNIPTPSYCFCCYIAIFYWLYNSEFLSSILSFSAA